MKLVVNGNLGLQKFTMKGNKLIPNIVKCNYDVIENIERLYFDENKFKFRYRISTYNIQNKNKFKYNVELNYIKNFIFLWKLNKNWFQREDNIRYLINIVLIILGIFVTI